MSDSIQRRTVTIVNKLGLHMRPADKFARLASEFDCKVELVKDDLRIDGKSVLSILTLGAGNGSQVELECGGADATQAIEALTELIESGFGISTEEQKNAPNT